MNRKTLIPLMTLLVLSIAAVAMARGNYGYGGGQGAMPQLSPENQAKVEAIFDKYDDKFQELRKEQWAKRTELEALVRSGKADKETIHALVKELSENREKIFTLHKDMSAEIEKETGLVIPMNRRGGGCPGLESGGCPGNGGNYNCPGGGYGGKGQYRGSGCPGGNC